MTVGNEKLVEIQTVILKTAIESQDETTLAEEIPLASALNTRLTAEIQAFRDNFEKQAEERKAATKKPPAKKGEEVEEFKLEDILDLALDPSLITQADYTL